MRKLLLALLIIINLLLVYSFFVEPNWLVTRRIQVPLSVDKSTYSGLRVVHISDLHLTHFSNREKLIVKRINELEPDIICLTGDLIALQHPFAPVVEFLNLLKATSGIYIVFGDADYSNMEDMIREYRARHLNRNIVFLRNESIAITWRGLPVVISGLDDPLTDRAAIKPLAWFERKKGLRIFLCHAYLSDKEYSAIQADLVLAGNTHGGQIRFLPDGVALQLVNRSKKETNVFLYGFHKYHHQYVNISKGIGMSFVPLRFGSRPEITFLQFQKE